MVFLRPRQKSRYFRLKGDSQSSLPIAPDSVEVVFKRPWYAAFSNR
jgi:hypothetical protein